MTIFSIGIAGLTVEMRCIYPFAQYFCRDFIVWDVVPDFSVEASDEEITAEIGRTTEEVTPEDAELVCLYRKIADNLPAYGRFVFHGAAISYREKAYLFTAPSGTGKTTHISLWRKVLGEEVGIINGDKPILCPTESGVTVYATPWAGKEGWYRNLSMPVGGVCLLEQAPENAIQKIRPQDALMRLLQQIYIPTDAAAAQKMLSLFERFCSNVPLYRCRCNISEEAVKTSFEALTGENFNDRT